MSSRLDAMSMGLPQTGIRGATQSERGAANRKLEDVAEQFEAVMLKEMVKSMHLSTLGDSASGSSSQGSAVLEDMMDDALAGHLAKCGGIGLAAYLETIGNIGSLKEGFKPPVSAIKQYSTTVRGGGEP